MYNVIFWNIITILILNIVLIYSYDGKAEFSAAIILVLSVILSFLNLICWFWHSENIACYYQQMFLFIYWNRDNFFRILW